MPSELRVDNINSTTSPYDPVFSTTGGALSHRNMVINGGMQIWQRATSATAAGSGTYTTVDRWRFEEGTGGAYTSERDTLSVADQGTTGHRSATKLVVTSTDTSLTGNEYAYMFTRLEGQDLQHLQYGSSNAKTITLSFWVKSNLTGTYCAYLRKVDNTAAYVVKEYTISSANTWEKKSITITPTEGSTTIITTSGGAIDNNNDFGLEIGFSLAFGPNYETTKDTWQTAEDYTTSSAVNWMGASNNFYITGVQLELGTVATPFEHRSYADELRRCMRYYCVLGSIIGTGYQNGSTQLIVPLGNAGVKAFDTSASGPSTMGCVTFRAIPTISGTLGTASFANHSGTAEFSSQSLSTIQASNTGTMTLTTASTFGTNGQNDNSSMTCYYNGKTINVESEI